MGKDPNFNSALLKPTVNRLFKLSESRGKEAAGLAVRYDKTINVFKQAISASSLLRTKGYKRLFNGLFNKGNSGKDKKSLTIVGHSRLVTSGAQKFNQNNQPVIKNGLVGVHNGIIVNDEEIWKQFTAMEREYEVDTEVMLSLIWHFYQDKKSLIEAVQSTFSLIRGVASTAVLFSDLNCLLLATNNGSLYYLSNTERKVFIFASEHYILKKLLQKRSLKESLGQYDISQIKPGYGCCIDLDNLRKQDFSLDKKTDNKPVIDINLSSGLNIIDLSPKDEQNSGSHGEGIDSAPFAALDSINILSPEDVSISSLRRCVKCVLPETFPFLKFDEKGVCNYCRTYNKNEVRGLPALEEVVAKYRSKSGEPDCVVGLSGGRDSTYGLHYIKNVLKMNPVAYTYDWGMITDLARRNISRICGKLGIEHVLVSADINKKRQYIRKNVEAWLKKPDLGIVPLFMAGDKQYFYYLHKLKKQTGANLTFFCENPLERTGFKSGFCGVNQECVNGESVDILSPVNKIKLAAYYAKQYLLNPLYINSSILDTLSAYICQYLMPRDYLNLYRFIQWDEKKIISTLIDEYDWEVATDTKTTWRIGDGTASFYNYIYYTIAGFTENDTFRSNQIREGIIGREEALKYVREENKPRFESMQWYCRAIGLDFEKALKVINAMPKLYKEPGEQTDSVRR